MLTGVFRVSEVKPVEFGLAFSGWLLDFHQSVQGEFLMSF
jgi:hypothetical protein